MKLPKILVENLKRNRDKIYALNFTKEGATDSCKYEFSNGYRCGVGAMLSSHTIAQLKLVGYNDSGIHEAIETINECEHVKLDRDQREWLCYLQNKHDRWDTDELNKLLDEVEVEDE